MISYPPVVPSGGTGAGLSSNHRDRPANPTAANGDPLIASALGEQPVGDIFVLVNGVEVGAPSYGSKVGAVWFSNDGGGTAAFRTELQPDTTVHFNPSAAGFRTQVGDKITLIYGV